MSRASRAVHKESQHQSQEEAVEPRGAVDAPAGSFEGLGDQGGERRPEEPPLTEKELKKLRAHMRMWPDLGDRNG